MTEKLVISAPDPAVVGIANILVLLELSFILFFFTILDF